MWQVHFGSRKSNSSGSGSGNISSSSSMCHRRQRAVKTSTSVKSNVAITSCFYGALVSLLMINMLCVQAAPPQTTFPSRTKSLITTTTTARVTTTTNQQPQHQPLARVQQCREGCYEKFATKETLCQQNTECLSCFEECAKPPPPKLNKSIHEAWSLHTVSMLLQDSLVLVDVAWSPLNNTPNQCLVTWEVSGGGLMGNLLTESYNVQLSLWPDTKYRVQVTCKNKLTGLMTRSLPLTIDTANSLNALDMQPKLTEKTKAQFPFALNVNNKQTSFDTTNNNLLLHFKENDLDEEMENNIEVTQPPPHYDEEQSVENLNEHNNFIFNWHAENNDISAIEPLHNYDFKTFNLDNLAELEKPLYLGIVAGIVVLCLLLIFYICILKHHNRASDKASLIDNEAQTSISSTTPTNMEQETCRDSVNCARNTLKV